MNIRTRVEGKVYDIECGDGYAPFLWLGLQACLLYGQEAYPRGKYVPSIVKIVEKGHSYIPHPQYRSCRKTLRCSIRDELKGVQTCEAEVKIRDSNRPGTEEEKSKQPL